MALQSYLSTTEATERFPGDADYTNAQKASALAQSYSLVNSYLDSKLKVPVLGRWDGETTQTAPGVLKISQGMFYQWLLQTSNVGYPEEMESLFKQTVELVKGVTANELSIPEAMTFTDEVGWHIAKVTQAAGGTGLGGVWVRGAAPAVMTHLRIVVNGIITGGETPSEGAGGYVGDSAFTFTIYRSDDATALSTLNVPYYEWHSYAAGNCTFELRWDGSWLKDSELRLVGVPESAVDQPTINKDTMTTAPVSY